MTKEEALQFKERWAAINQFTIEEARRKTPEQRLAELGALYQFGITIGWPTEESREVEQVRVRWQKLRAKLGVKSEMVEEDEINESP